MENPKISEIKALIEKHKAGLVTDEVFRFQFSKWCKG